MDCETSQCRIAETVIRGTAKRKGSCRKYEDRCCPIGSDVRSVFAYPRFSQLVTLNWDHSYASVMEVQRELMLKYSRDRTSCGELATRTLRTTAAPLFFSVEMAQPLIMVWELG